MWKTCRLLKALARTLARTLISHLARPANDPGTCPPHSTPGIDSEDEYIVDRRAFKPRTTRVTAREHVQDFFQKRNEHTRPQRRQEIQEQYQYE
ncbi:hypothetical protein B0O80DRAFT_463264, partial [Mortierella sp. GBAus27b]